jgi:hypothetical protein
MRSFVSFICISSSFGFAACARNPNTNTDTAESAVDSSDSVESEGNVMMALADGADGTATALTGITAEQAAAHIAANVPLRWQPSGCATATVSGASVTVTLTDCTGPRGLLHVTGEIDLAVSITTAGAVAVHATANDLAVNAATISFDADATYTANGTMHSLAVQAHGDGTGPRGTTIDHDGNYTIDWDTATQCRSIAGSWSTEFTNGTASATRGNDVNLMRCSGSCPNGTLVHHFLGGQTLTVTFDGTSTASWATSGGRSGTVQLACP